MLHFRRAQVVVTEGERDSLISRAIQWATGVPWTHAFIIVGPNLGVEAWFPRVRTLSVRKRIEELEREGRRYVVLEAPTVGIVQRILIADKALSYVGRWYDVGQAALYFVTSLWNRIRGRGGSGSFWQDGTGTLICSRLVTASYLSGGSIDLFSDVVLAENFPPDHPRIDNLRNGYATPGELLQSALKPVV